ncbi:DUF5133 domain-containing protein [Streptomyces sp. NPDC091377]|uniref:DUF5133 domain-containing protein n=1 Tax=unclassified Streptomyces TaxID=2593676 RepID=UPI003818EAEF
MPVPDPKAVRELLTRYAALRIAQAERERPAVKRELADVTGRLCELMGTADLPEAIAKADGQLTSGEGVRRGAEEGNGLPVAV